MKTEKYLWTVLEVMEVALNALKTGSKFFEAQELLTSHIDILRKRRRNTSEIPPHQSHSDTSTAAAISEAPKFKGKRLIVLRHLNKTNVTDEQGQNNLGMSGNTYRPCRAKLVEEGFVYDTGRRAKTLAKKDAVIWAITDKGRQYLKENTHVS